MLIIFFKMRQCGIWEDCNILEYKDLNKNFCHLLASVYEQITLILRLSFSPMENRIAT